MTLPPGKMSREQLKSRLDHSLQLHRQWTSWISQQTPTAAEPDPKAKDSMTSASLMMNQQSLSGRPASALRRAASASSSRLEAGWTPICRRDGDNENSSSCSPPDLAPRAASVGPAEGTSREDVFSFSGLSAGEVLSLAGLQQAVKSVLPLLGGDMPAEAKGVATLEALCVILREHPLLGPILSTVFDTVCKSVYFIPLPFLCEASVPPHLAPGSDNPQLWAKWVDARACRWGKLHTQKMGMPSGTGATLLLGAEMDQMSEELRANRITAQASKRNSQQIRLNYVQGRKVLKVHFKSWRQLAQTAKGKQRAAERIANLMNTMLKRFYFLNWRIHTLNDLYHRKDDHCSRLQSVLKDETKQLNLTTEKLDSHQRQRDIAVTNVEQMRGIVADLERRLAATKSPMVLDFRRPLSILHKSSSDVLECGTVHFRASTEIVPVQTPDLWHGEYGCERQREGVAIPGREKYASRYHIRVEAAAAKITDPTLEWANNLVIAFCQSHFANAAAAAVQQQQQQPSTKPSSTQPLTSATSIAVAAHFGDIQTAYEQYDRDCQIRMQIWNDHMREMRDMEKDNIVQITPTGFVSMSCELNTFSDAAEYPYVYAALLAELAPQHILLFHRSLAAFISSATLSTVFAVLKSAGVCGGLSEAEFCETRRVSPTLREAIHRVVLSRLRTMSILKAPWDAMNAARYPGQQQQQQLSAGDASNNNQQGLGAGTSGVLRMKKGPGLSELVVQRSSTDGLADETAEDVLAWVRLVLQSKQTPQSPLGSSGQPQQQQKVKRRRVVTKKVEEELLQHANLVHVANLEEDMGDGLAFLGLVTQCLIPPEAALPDPLQIVSVAAVPSGKLFRPTSSPSNVSGKKSAMSPRCSPRPGSRSPRAANSSGVLSAGASVTSGRFGGQDDIKTSPSNPLGISAFDSSSTSQLEAKNDDEDDASEALAAIDEQSIPTEAQAFATYLCTTVRDVLGVTLPPLVWSSLHTCTRSVKLIFLTALYLKCHGVVSVPSAAMLDTSVVAAGSQGEKQIRQHNSPGRKGAVGDSPGMISATPTMMMVEAHVSPGRNSNSDDASIGHQYLQLTTVPGMPSVVPDLATLKAATSLSAKDSQMVRHVLTRCAPFISSIFMRMMILCGGDELKLPVSALKTLFGETGQPKEVVTAWENYLSSLQASAAASQSTTSHEVKILTFSHIDFSMALAHVAKLAAVPAAGDGSVTAPDVVLYTMINSMACSDLLQLVYDAGNIRKRLMCPQAVQFLRSQSKLLIAVYIRFSDWIDDKYKILEQRCMTEQQFVDAVYSKCIDTIDEGATSISSAWSPNIKKLSQQPTRSLPWPLLVDGAHVAKLSEFSVRSVFRAVCWSRSGDQKGAEAIASGMGSATQAMLTATQGTSVTGPRPVSLRFSGFLEALIGVSKMLVPSPWITPDVKLSVLMDILEGCYFQSLQPTPQ